MCNKLKQTKFYQQSVVAYRAVSARIKLFIAGHKKGFCIGVAAVAVVAVLLRLIPCGSAKIGVLDVDRLRSEAAIYKTIATEQQKYEEVWKMKFMAEKEVLDQEDKELARAAKEKKIKPAQLRRQVEELQKKALDLQKKYQGEAAKILAASKSVLTQADDLMLQVAAVVAQDNGYDIVLPDRVIYASERADITDEVIKALDKKAVQIKYPDPQTLTPADMN